MQRMDGWIMTVEMIPAKSKSTTIIMHDNKFDL